MSSSTPISIQTPSSLAAAQSTDAVVCTFCHRQFAKYTCPTCNAQYCSLTCFRSETHAQCSETFYKKEIETGIKAEPSKTAEERRQMLEVLKRFEEDSADDDGALEDDEDASDLAIRLAEVDLESASSDTIWSMLSPEQQKKFMQAIRDPSSEVAQQLLASEELRGNIREPWWEHGEEPTISRSQSNDVPEMMDIPEAMLKPIPNRPLLVYNLVSLCLTYAFIIRHLGLASLSSPHTDHEDLEAAYQLLRRFSPFLIDRKSTLVYGSLAEVVSDLWSRFDRNTPFTPDLLSSLLVDAIRLMSPIDIIENPSMPVNALTLHPNRSVLLILSDLERMISGGIAKGWVPQQSKHVSHKLVFYGAHIATMPRAIVRALIEDLRARHQVALKEAKEGVKGSVVVERVGGPRRLVAEV